MLTVVASLPLQCGCTTALIGDDGTIYACAADGRGHGFCECSDGPSLCEHLAALALVMAGLI